MTMVYGEGCRAFQRLQEEIIKVSEDQSVFAWGLGKRGRNGDCLLARSPADFEGCRKIVPWGRPGKFELSSRALRIRLPLLKADSADSAKILGLLNCQLENDLSGMLAIGLQRAGKLNEYAVKAKAPDGPPPGLQLPLLDTLSNPRTAGLSSPTHDNKFGDIVSFDEYFQDPLVNRRILGEVNQASGADAIAPSDSSERWAGVWLAFIVADRYATATQESVQIARRYRPLAVSPRLWFRLHRDGYHSDEDMQVRARYPENAWDLDTGILQGNERSATAAVLLYSKQTHNSMAIVFACHNVWDEAGGAYRIVPAISIEPSIRALPDVVELFEPCEHSFGKCRQLSEHGTCQESATSVEMALSDTEQVRATIHQLEVLTETLFAVDVYAEARTIGAPARSATSHSLGSQQSQLHSRDNAMQELENILESMSS